MSPQVESPLAMDAVLGESAFSVTDDKVSITEMRVSAISGLTLTLHPSPGNSHTIVAKATGVQTLTAPKQVECGARSRIDRGNGTSAKSCPVSGHRSGPSALPHFLEFRGLCYVFHCQNCSVLIALGIKKGGGGVIR